MDGVAVDDYDGAKGEISVTSGETVRIHGMENDNFYRAEVQKSGARGLVPQCFVQLPLWYKGAISRQSAERMLMRNDQRTGAFLVRSSRRHQGEFALSVRNGDKVQHFIFQRDPQSGKYFIWSAMFETINELVNHHHQTTISMDSNLLLVCAANGPKKARALYPHKTDEEEELSFGQGDILDIVDSADPGWWKAKNNDGKTGLVPVNFLEVCDGEV